MYSFYKFSHAVVYFVIPASSAHRLTSLDADWPEPLPTLLEDDPRVRRVADSLKAPLRPLEKDSVRVLYTSFTSLKLFASSIDSTTDLL